MPTNFSQMPINPMQMISMIKDGANPQQLVMSILEQGVSGNPLYENLFALAKANNGKEIENVARNMMKEKGLDFDKEFNSFKSSLGL